MSTNNYDHINKVRESMGMFTMAVAILAAASFLFSKIGVWVPLMIQSYGNSFGLAMLIVMVAAGVCVAIAAGYLLVASYGELLPTRWQIAAIVLTALVMCSMFVGVIVEGSFTIKKTQAEIKQQERISR